MPEGLYAPPAPGSRLGRVLAVWRRHQRVYFKFLLANILPPFLEPLMLILTLGLGLEAFIGPMEQVSYAAFLAPGVIAVSVLWSASFEATYGTFMRMEYEKIYDGILATPVSFLEMILGEVLWISTKCAAFSLSVLATVSAFGLVDSWWSLLVVPIGFLGGMVFALLSLVVTSQVREINNFNFYLTGVITPMFYFSGTFFPVSGLPAPLRAVGWSLPMTHVVSLMRACCQGSFHPGLLWFLAGLVAYLALLWPLAVRLLRRRILV